MTNSVDSDCPIDIESGGQLMVNNGHNVNRHYAGYFILEDAGYCSLFWDDEPVTSPSTIPTPGSPQSLDLIVSK